MIDVVGIVFSCCDSIEYFDYVSVYSSVRLYFGKVLILKLLNLFVMISVVFVNLIKLFKMCFLCRIFFGSSLENNMINSG